MTVNFFALNIINILISIIIIGYAYLCMKMLLVSRKTVMEV